MYAFLLQWFVTTAEKGAASRAAKAASDGAGKKVRLPASSSPDR